MPIPAESGRRYLPGLDGLRAIAVLAVVAYHLGLGWAPGGLLGVGVFFTLSGYLITDLLLEHRERHGRMGLGRFWLARARRLLPGLVTMLTLVIAWVTVAHRPLLHEVRSLVAPSLGFVSNWWLIGQHQSYFGRFQAPSPLAHLWSLAVEEQFYLLWPWLLLAGMWAWRRIGRPPGSGRVALAIGTALLALASAAWMAAQYRPGFDMTRIYEGTDTRAFGLLGGAALAMVWPSRLLRAPVRRGVRLGLDAAGVAGLATIVVLIARTEQYSAFLYRGGMALLTVASILVVAALAHPAGRLAAVLGWGPLRWIGVRSYGIYLWQLPVIVLTGGGTGSGPHPVRATLQVAAILVLAALSWRYVEDPIRHGALARWWHRRGVGGTPAPAWHWVAPALAVAVLATALVGLVAPAPRAVGSELAASTRITVHSLPPGTDRPPGVPAPPSGDPTAGGTLPGSAASQPAAPQPPVPQPPVPQPPASHSPVPRSSAPPTRTSCTSVVHIGDSTSEGLVSPSYLPDPAQRIDAQYARVGVGVQHLEIIGGTSILETAEAGQPNAFAVASTLIKGGFRGCWVLALGTNDTADVAVGSALDRAGRIAKMMTLLAGQRVLWVNVRSLRDSGPYSEANMQAWDAALVAACPEHPSMRIYDWAAVVQNGWFINDGIHFTTPGYAQRSQRIADALVHAFPAGRLPSTGCVVN